MDKTLIPENQDKDGIVELAARYVCPGRVDTFKALGTVPVMGRREGNYFWDVDGRKLFDVHINGGTYNLGHRNPEVMSALREAMDHYDIGNHHFASVARTRLAERLIEVAPGAMHYAVFTAGGAEAIDVTIRTARRVTGRRKVVAFREAYHGHGGLGLRAGGYEKLARFFLSERPEGEFVLVPFNDPEAMEDALKAEDVAAVLSEMIPATSGFLMPSADYFKTVKKLCEAHGALFIADEVQTGLGRTGRFWASQGYGIAPDMLVTGKGLSGGVYPIAAALLSEEVAGWLREDGWGYSATFGGAEIGCVVAHKVLEITGRPGVLENVRAMSELLKKGLAEIQGRHPFLVEVRQNGLIIGLRTGDPYGGMMLAACCFESGLWAFPAGFERSVLQFKPNILVDRAACEEAMSLLEDSIRLCEKKFLTKKQ
jgi:acetylornithine/succinyldiaminopimelate/putrescine aminotransferase